MSAMSRHPIIEPAEIKRLVAENQPVVIHEGYVLHLGDWIHRHPGGRLAILHMVGRDATDEINIYHSNKALLMMTKHRIGRVQLPWANLEPPIRSPEYYKNLKLGEKSGVVAHADGARSNRRSVDLGSAAAILSKKLMPANSCVRRTSITPDPEKLPLLESETPSIITAEEKSMRRERFAIEEEEREIAEGQRDNPSLDVDTQRAIIEDYRALHAQFKAEGLYQCRYSEYGKECLRYGFLFAVFGYMLYIKWYMTSAVFLGLFWQQLMFTAHDAGHRGITGNFVADTLIGAFIADFCCGLSIGWWKSSHNVHHLVTNMPEHDPDLQNIPSSPRPPTYMKSILSSYYNWQFVWDGACDIMLPYQKYLYYPIIVVGPL